MLRAAHSPRQLDKFLELHESPEHVNHLKSWNLPDMERRCAYR